MPINRKSLFGYTFFVIFQTIGYFCTIYITVPTVGLYVGACWLFIDFIRDIIAIDLNPIIDIENTKPTQFEVKTHFFRLVQVYSAVKQLSEYFYHNSNFVMNSIFSFVSRFAGDFNAVYEFKTFRLFIWTLLTTCSSLLVFLAQLVKYNQPSICD